ncbi:MAG: hypothetical protein P1U70_19300, partial [Saprospiraceae bacterium]|nr:hypothetical protein [Saprospiraceae bacterium]
TFMTYRNLMLTMLLGGLWHGASWVFVFWGFLHGSYLVIQRLFGNKFGILLNYLHLPKTLQIGINIFLVYIFTCLAWIFFRSPDFETAVHVITGIANFQTFTVASIVNKFLVLKGFLLIGLLLTIEIADFNFDLNTILIKNAVFRVVSFAAIIWLIALFGTFDSNAFIYFQF